MQQASYSDIVSLFEAMPHSSCVVTDLPTNPNNVKKGLDRAIRKCGYSMTAHVCKGEVLINKKGDEGQN
ncbi:MAG: hypothetical protein WDA59_01720 [Methanofastidiosum sp.]